MARTQQRPTGAENVAWDLADLFSGADDPKLEAELADAARSADAFRERYHGRVASLSAAEIARLQKFIATNGGQEKVGVSWGVNSSTLSRIIHRHHAPSPMLAQKLAEIGVVQPAK